MSIEKTLDSRIIYEGKIIKVRVDRVLLPNNREATREVVEHPGAVSVIPIKDGNVIFVKQFRKPVEEELLEIPAGKLEKGEDINECVKRELQEETGYIAENIRYITSFYTSPGFSNEIMHLFVAENLKKTVANTDEDEFIEIEEIPIGSISDIIKMGKIKDSKTLIGLLYYFYFVGGKIENL